MLSVPRQSTSLLGNNQAAVIFPVLFWGNAIDFPEIPQERGVIRKAGLLPALSNVLPLRHGLAGGNDPLVHNKVMHRHAGDLLEFPQKMILTHVHGLRHFLHCDLLAEMGLDVAGHLLHQRMIHDLLCGRQIFLPFTQHIQIPKKQAQIASVHDHTDSAVLDIIPL